MQSDSLLVDPRRKRLRQTGTLTVGSVIYWMGRDMRAKDNWALLAAAESAKRSDSPLYVVYAIPPTFVGATWRHYDFLLKGLEQVENELRALGIPLIAEVGNPIEILPRLARDLQARSIYMDTNPLKIVNFFKEQVMAAAPDQTFVEVDAHNVVPWWVASDKEEFGAYTLRPKLERLLPEFLTEFPSVPDFKTSTSHANDWVQISNSILADASVKPVQMVPGETAGKRRLTDFLDRIEAYPEDRNDPNKNGQSGLSPWLHMGHLSAQRVLLEMDKTDPSPEARKAFQNEVLVWREVAENFCAFNQSYDELSGARDWAKASHQEHRDDPREVLYTYDQLERGETYDDLWNAAQWEMVNTGKMHGYLRMFWAKQILAWTPSVEVALQTAIQLNDKFSIDGNDSNGYAGIMWSLCGVHDRAWFDRPVFGKIRYMNRNGCERKFDVKAYIAKQTQPSLLG
ncbi:MAG TPA: deoxyribodipyrimidine photo-lyase [Fimbriimonas sp.]|nr:deoxyribodipyrimidine photo-lyase [Fimbriimonas sp.]